MVFPYCILDNYSCDAVEEKLTYALRKGYKNGGRYVSHA